MKDTSVECAELLRALADKDRLRIVRVLGDGEKNVGELAEALNVDIANVSHHLGVLHHAGILTREKRGRFVVYQIHPNMLTQARHAADRLDLGCCSLVWPQEPG